MVTLKKIKKWLARFIYVAIPRFLKGEAVVADEAGNVALLAGNPHGTMSEHCGNQFAAGNPCILCRCICWTIQNTIGRIWPSQRHHCANAWKAERAMIAASVTAAGVDPQHPNGPV